MKQSGDRYIDDGVAAGTFWWACAEPERPTDPLVVWHVNCGPCYLKAEAVGWQARTEGRTVPGLQRVLDRAAPPTEPVDS